jgi:large subunit ribosomal protein L2
MALKQYKPVTSSQRQLVLNTREDLWKGKPEKALTEGKRKSGGRNNMGHVTTRHIGGGHKQLYRVIDFKRLKHDMEATVLRLEYDPNRTGYIALIEYKDGTRTYILAPQRLAKGDKISSGPNADIKPGNALPLKNMPVGTIVHNVELKLGKGGQLSRSAGCYAQVVGRDSGYVQVKLSSGELRIVKGDCMATVGAMSNADHMNESYAKAGRQRWKGIRPTVRGVAMNPVDHPHGGGEGRTSGGRHPVTPWGKGTKGTKTRTNKSTDKFIIRRRKKKNGRA